MLPNRRALARQIVTVKVKERNISMSYMDTNLGIQELSQDEVEQVEGGIIVAVAILAGAACILIGWQAAHNRAEAAE